MAAWVLVEVRGIFSCGMRDLVPRPRMELRPPALGAWSLIHWTTREVPACFEFQFETFIQQTIVRSRGEGPASRSFGYVVEETSGLYDPGLQGRWRARGWTGAGPGVGRQHTQSKRPLEFGAHGGVEGNVHLEVENLGAWIPVSPLNCVTFRQVSLFWTLAFHLEMGKEGNNVQRP